jgi:hypothetical protein
VCPSCRRRRSNSLRRRMTEGLTSAWSRATSGGARCGLRLLTLTLRHSGSVDEDRRALLVGWRAFYKAAHRWLGKSRQAATGAATSTCTRRSSGRAGSTTDASGRCGCGHVRKASESTSSAAPTTSNGPQTTSRNTSRKV